MDNSEQLSALERLSKLRDSGAITPQEFVNQKALILGATATADGIPFYRRLWVVVLLTCLLVTFWISFLILVTGDVYRKSHGARVPIRRVTRLIYASLLGLWLTGLVVKTAWDPGSVKREWDESATDYKQTEASPTQATTSQSPAAAQSASNSPNAASARNPPDTCDSSDAADMVKQAVEGSAASKLVQIKLLDFGHQQEIFFDRPANTRYCQADAALNTGDAKLSYKLYYGFSGENELVEVKTGEDAYGMSPQSRASRSATQDELQNDRTVPSTEADPTPTAPSEGQPDGQPNAPTDNQQRE